MILLLKQRSNKPYRVCEHMGKHAEDTSYWCYQCPSSSVPLGKPLILLPPDTIYQMMDVKHAICKIMSSSDVLI